jgi:DNA-binding XRE family transcriptional regulator/Zn ribbon nucleic-acid-binding protein
VTETKAFIDAVCPKCKTKIGWFGRAVDRPPCRRCGFQIPKDVLEHDQAKMDRFRELLAGLRAANPGWERWREARSAAGLTLRQAAKLLEVAPTTLSEIERGENRPSEALTGRMIRCYGGEGLAVKE